MQLRVKATSKIIKPKEIVDKAFEAQGFTKKMKKNYPYYQLRIKDNSTRMSYELQIPIQEFIRNEKTFCKIQEITIHPKTIVKRTQHVPKEILTAAKEKVREVFSYLD